MNEATTRWAEHRSDVETLRAAGYFDSPRGVSFVEAFAKVRDAYGELEHAFDSHDAGATSEAAKCWWNALQGLREAAIGEGR